MGLFKISRQITPVSFRLELPSNYRISPTFHVSLLKPAGGPRGETEEGAQPQTPLPFLVDGEEAYRVHELLDSRRHPPVSGWLAGVRSWGVFLGHRRRHPRPYPYWGISQDASRETGPSTSGETPASLASSRQELLAGGGLCYRGGSCTASSTPPEGTLTWILVSCHSDSISHFPSYLGLINHPHLFPIYTHTYKPHTHTDPLRSLDLPCCHFWAFYPCLPSCYLTLDCLLVISDCLLPAPTWIVFIGLWLFAPCPDLLPGVLLCLCLASTVLPCRRLTLYCLTILNKTANGS